MVLKAGNNKITIVIRLSQETWQKYTQQLFFYLILKLWSRYRLSSLAFWLEKDTNFVKLKRASPTGHHRFFVHCIQSTRVECENSWINVKRRWKKEKKGWMVYHSIQWRYEAKYIDISTIIETTVAKANQTSQVFIVVNRRPCGWEQGTMENNRQDCDHVFAPSRNLMREPVRSYQPMLLKL